MKKHTDTTRIYWHGTWYEMTPDELNRLADAGPSVWTNHCTWDEVLGKIRTPQLSLFPQEGTLYVDTFLY